jgi:hypothetical protein
VHLDLQVPSNHLLKKPPGPQGVLGDLLMAEPGYQNIITTDLVDDPMLTDSNIRTFKKAYKELYDFAMVRRDDSSACIRSRVA